LFSTQYVVIEDVVGFVVVVKVTVKVKEKEK
jgi:hypothetical protein